MQPAPGSQPVLRHDPDFTLDMEHTKHIINNTINITMNTLTDTTNTQSHARHQTGKMSILVSKYFS